MAFRKSPTKNRGIVRGKKQPQSFAEEKRIYYDFTDILEEQQPEDSSSQNAAF